MIAHSATENTVLPTSCHPNHLPKEVIKKEGNGGRYFGDLIAVLFSQLAATINLGFNEKSGEKYFPNQHAC